MTKYTTNCFVLIAFDSFQGQHEKNQVESCFKNLLKVSINPRCFKQIIKFALFSLLMLITHHLYLLILNTL